MIKFNHLYSPATFVYLSGTGNSYRVARWMGECVAEAGGSATLVPLARAGEDALSPPRDPDDPPASGADDGLFGLVCPTHGFTAPWAMIAFALRLPRGRGRRAVAVATRAGVRWGWFEIFGIAASNAFLLAFLLFLKGYRIPGVLSVNMPSNWLSLHWGLHPRNARRCIDTSRPKVRTFMSRILSGRRAWLSANNLLEFAWMLLLWPITLAYLLVGRRWLAKLFFANTNCVGCGLCARTCPVGAIRMTGGEGGKKPRPYWLFSCESCMRCMAFCPSKAVEAGQSWGALTYFLVTVPTTAFLLPLALSTVPGLEVLGRDNLSTLLATAFVLPALLVFYWIFHQALRVPLINRLFAWTTLTHWWRHYHEPDTRLPALTRIEVVGGAADGDSPGKT